MKILPGPGQSREHRVLSTGSAVWRKKDIYGSISYEAENHEIMVHRRKEKIENVRNEIPALQIDGDREGDLLVVSWEAVMVQLRKPSGMRGKRIPCFPYSSALYQSFPQRP